MIESLRMLFTMGAMRRFAAAALLVAASSAYGQSFGDGTHLVGSAIQAGTYRAPSGEWCMWERLSGLSGMMSDWIAGDVPTGRTIVEIKATDKAFKASGCGTWILVDEGRPSSGTDLQQSYAAFVASLVHVVERSLVEDILDAMEDDLQDNPYGITEHALLMTMTTIDSARELARDE